MTHAIHQRAIATLRADVADLSMRRFATSLADDLGIEPITLIREAQAIATDVAENGLDATIARIAVEEGLTVDELRADIMAMKERDRDRKDDAGVMVMTNGKGH